MRHDRKTEWIECSAIVVAVLLLAALMIELISIQPHYAEEMATVRKVVREDTEWGYLGTDHMTLLRFDDGWDDTMGGDRGEPGDRILARRERGTKSLFGIFGDRRNP